MSQHYPLVEAIFEIRWGEVSPGKFNFTSSETDIFYQQFAMQAAQKNYLIVETPNSDAPLVPHLVKYRYRKEPNTWPCYQVGIGVFTVNQVKDGYKKKQFLSDISVGVNSFIKAIGNDLNHIKNSLSVTLRYQNAFYAQQNADQLGKLEETFGIKINFPEKFASNIERINSVDLRFGLNCLNPEKSTANIAIQNAIIDGRPGIFVDTVIASKLNDIVFEKDDIEESIFNWIIEAYKFQKETYVQLMEK